MCIQFQLNKVGGSSLFPSSFIWNVNVQPKISFFAWEYTWGKALTLDMVQKRGQALANRCFMCLEKEENINHLPLNCSRTRVLWDLLFALFGVSWVSPSSVRETLLSWNGFFLGKNRKKAWRAAPLHIFWMVWKERNRLAFKDESLSIQRLKRSFILTFWAEAKLFIDDCPLTITNFIDWLGSKQVCGIGFSLSFGLVEGGCIGIVYLESLFQRLFFNEILFTYQKKTVSTKRKRELGSKMCNFAKYLLPQKGKQDILLEKGQG